MTEPTNVVRLRQPDDVDDPLSEVLRLGAKWELLQPCVLGETRTAGLSPNRWGC